NDVGVLEPGLQLAWRTAAAGPVPGPRGGLGRAAGRGRLLAVRKLALGVHLAGAPTGGSAADGVALTRCRRWRGRTGVARGRSGAGPCALAGAAVVASAGDRGW